MILAFQLGNAHQEFVHFAGALTAFADRPYHERLSTAAVAGCENLLVGSRLVPVGFDVAALIEFQVEVVQQAFLLRVQEAGCH